MPVYVLPAADVEAAVAAAISSSEAVARARADLEHWDASPHGREVAAAVAAGQMTAADASQFTLQGSYARDLDNAVAAVRNRVTGHLTMITTAEVKAGLRRMWPSCYLSVRDTGANQVDITLPERPARELLGRGREQAGALLGSLLRLPVQVTGTRQVTVKDMEAVRVTARFPLPGKQEVAA